MMANLIFQRVLLPSNSEEGVGSHSGDIGMDLKTVAGSDNLFERP